MITRDDTPWATDVSRAGGPQPDRRVLCVDDDWAVLDLTTSMLRRKADVTTTAESDPAAALDRVESERFDCVVSDYEMPGMDGLELLSAVRERVGGIPFVLFTGTGSEAIASEANSAGVTVYLQKGSGTDQYAVLATRVEQAIERRRSQRRPTDERARRAGSVRNDADALGEITGSPPRTRESTDAVVRTFGAEAGSVSDRE